eukprot:15440665-Alexandrium_andersonii.AAC.1
MAALQELPGHVDIGEVDQEPEPGADKMIELAGVARVHVQWLGRALLEEQHGSFAGLPALVPRLQ